VDLAAEVGVSTVGTGDLSSKIAGDAARVIPGGVNSFKRDIDPPLSIRRANGSYLEDVDGRRYLDFHAAFSAVILGHCYPEVVRRVAAAIQDTVLVGVGTTEAEVELATKVTHHVPSAERVLLCNSGSEATFHALRVARAVTGRQKILKFQGCYHGFHDYTLRNVLSAPDKIGKRDPHSAGMLEAGIDNTLVCRFNDLADVEKILDSNGEEIAAIIVEPIAHNALSILPQPGFLEGLRELSQRYGSLLIFDEVITGFRHDLGGYQAIAGVMPDLTTMGKAMANGFGVAAVGGKASVMERFSTHPDGDVEYAGTYNANSVAVAAALATIEVLESEPVHAHTYRLGERMRDGLGQIIKHADVQGSVRGYGSLFGLYFLSEPVNSYDDVVRNNGELCIRYRQELVARGVFEKPGRVARSHILYTHTEDDVDRALGIAEEALAAALGKRARVA
jgi:glutamate-1-semialdehyde 2,1-aminomutase